MDNATDFTLYGETESLNTIRAGRDAARAESAMLREALEKIKACTSQLSPDRASAQFMADIAGMIAASALSSSPSDWLTATIADATNAVWEERDEWKLRAEKVEAERDEMQQLFDLQHTRTMEAIALWRAGNPGNELVQPDLGALLTWLMEQITQSVTCNPELAALRQERDRLSGIVEDVDSVLDINAVVVVGGDYFGAISQVVQLNVEHATAELRQERDALKEQNAALTAGLREMQGEHYCLGIEAACRLVGRRTDERDAAIVRAEKAEGERDGYAATLDKLHRDGKIGIIHKPSVNAHLARIRAEARKAALLEAADKADALGDGGLGRLPMLIGAELRQMAEEEKEAGEAPNGMGHGAAAPTWSARGRYLRPDNEVAGEVWFSCRDDDSWAWRVGATAPQYAPSEAVAKAAVERAVRNV